MFLERRVYQGSSGKVYPLPVYNRVEEAPTLQSWDALHIENDFIRVMILPQLGGRIHIALDKTNGYDFIYRQDVIKPAMVGLAGPWASGGIEFNWPQHHRPATYMPVDTEIESHADGSQTVWLSDHDPMNRLKGMHGIHLSPDRAAFEIKVRLYNRTEFTQTFLWWTNIATRAHEQYQSFFPTDVQFIADHARRAMSAFPLCESRYYGVDYAARAQDGVPASERPPHYQPPPGMYRPNDLSWYANIPVPTSYMCIGSEGDFVGGYDHAASAGIVHVANHHIAPGKKQWTWGNHEFGYAWDRNLTEPDPRGEYRPYIEIMAGVFTDNQPDFSFLAPGETKTFSQFMYPIKSIGPACCASKDLAASLPVNGQTIRVNLQATRRLDDAVLMIRDSAGGLIHRSLVQLDPSTPWSHTVNAGWPIEANAISLEVRDADGSLLLQHHPSREVKAPPEPATEIPPPHEIRSVDELYLSGVHLAQYRHATRHPEAYWEEALQRDPLDSRCNTALGIRRLRAGEFEQAEKHFRDAIARVTARNANPSDGEPFYHLGLALRFLNKPKLAYDAFYKAVWNAAWRTPAYLSLAQLDCVRRDWSTALQHLDLAIQTDINNLRARNLKVRVLRELHQNDQADALLRDNRSLDRLDWMARFLAGEPLSCDTQTMFDLVLELVRSGFHEDATALLRQAAAEPIPGTEPLLHYYLARVLWEQNRDDDAQAELDHAAKAKPDFCFPARLEEIAILEWAIARNPQDAMAAYYLGNLLYDRRRFAAAIRAWEQSVAISATFPTVWRNLGIAYFNIRGDAKSADSAYRKALALDSNDARLLYEHDQLEKRIGVSPTLRLQRLASREDLVLSRDDLSIEFCSLLNQVGRHAEALRLLQSRVFQPWEGGEGHVLAQHVRTHVALARAALKQQHSEEAIEHLESALQSPANLGEAKHLLANQSDVHYWLGMAYESKGDLHSARRYWKLSAEKRGDFIGMAVQPFSEMTYYSILSLRKLGQPDEAKALAAGLAKHAAKVLNEPAKIDYFATSLPTLLLFEDDLNRAKNASAQIMLAQAALISGDVDGAKSLLNRALALEPFSGTAADLVQEHFDAHKVVTSGGRQPE